MDGCSCPCLAGDAKVGGTTTDNVKKKIEDMSDDELNSRVSDVRDLLQEQLRPDSDGLLTKFMTESIWSLINELCGLTHLRDTRARSSDVARAHTMISSAHSHEPNGGGATSSGTSAPSTSTTS